MARRAQLSTEKRAAIVALRRAGHSIREIARLENVSAHGVRFTVKRFAETGGNQDRQRTGRPMKTTKREDLFILVSSKRDRFKSARDLRAELLESGGTNISVTQVKSRLRRAGLFGRVSARKPFLREANRKKRLTWAKDHKDWTPADWRRVLFTDESKFEVFGSKRRLYVRRRPRERMLPACITPTVKHGNGSVMVWGSFGGGNVGDLIRIEGRMDKKIYHRILTRNAVPSGLRLIGRGFTFQQDNDPKHTSHLCLNYLRSKESRNDLRVMKWPPQSPDCNPIELLWDHLDRAVRDQRVSNPDMLWGVLQNKWAEIELEVLERLTNRMPRVCAAVIAAKGRFFDESKI